MIGGDDIVADLERGSEAYLQMWERAVGVTSDACRDAAATRGSDEFAELEPGTAVRDVLLAVGQPHMRQGREFAYCTADGSDLVDVWLTFDDSGTLSVVDHRAGGQDGSLPRPEIDQTPAASSGGTGTDGVGTAATGGAWSPVTALLPHAGSPGGLFLWAILGLGLLVLGGKLLRPGLARPSVPTRLSLRERSERYRR